MADRTFSRRQFLRIKRQSHLLTVATALPPGAAEAAETLPPSGFKISDIQDDPEVRIGWRQASGRCSWRAVSSIHSGAILPLSTCRRR